MAEQLPDDPKLSPELKAKWLQALRGGEYAQTREKLRDDDGFCCLGVLCDLVDPKGWGADEWGDTTFTYNDDEASGSLPSSMNLKFIAGKDENKLIAMNDDEGKSFSEIADWVEANL